MVRLVYNRDDNHQVKEFKLELLPEDGEQWFVPENMIMVENGGKIVDDHIHFIKEDYKAELWFRKITGIIAIRVTTFDSYTSNGNCVLTEIIPQYRIENREGKERK